MLYDYGTLYNINTSDPYNSLIFTSWLASGTNVINKSDDLSPIPSIFYMEDNNEVQEASYLASSGGVRYLYVNHVSGTSSIYLYDQIEVDPSRNYPTTIGIKKASPTLYYVYGFSTLDSTSTEIVLDFRRTDGISGSSSNDSSLQTINISIGSGELWGTTRSIIGRSLYVSLFYNVTTSGFTGIEFRLYRADMDTETFEEINSYSLPSEENIIYSSVNGIVDFMGVLEDRGGIKWWIDYSKTQSFPDFPFPPELITMYVYFDGTVTSVFDAQPFSGSQPLNRNLYKYNYRDTKVIRSFTHSSITHYLVIDSVMGVSIQTTNAEFPDAIPVTFSSPSFFPKVGQSGSFYWLDEFGKMDTVISFPEVNAINSIYPTLDTINGSFYMNARMTDGTHKILAVDPNLREIIYIFDLVDFPYTSAPHALTNHGKFFISNKVTPTTRNVISYVVDVPNILKANDVLSILEMN